MSNNGEPLTKDERLALENRGHELLDYNQQAVNYLYALLERYSIRLHSVAPSMTDAQLSRFIAEMEGLADALQRLIGGS